MDGSSKMREATTPAKAREMTQLDRETGKKFIRVTEDHKMREGGPLWPRRKRSAS